MQTPLVLDPDAPAWPTGLEDLDPAPDRLWLRGDAAWLDPPRRVAVVGSRAASPYGLAQARRFASALAAEGLVIVSGLARGVDAAAHVGALDVGGGTLAVLGSGVDRPWPDGPLARRVAREGLLLSEHPPGQGPRRHHFPLRNRLIAALCDAVLVVEAAHVSGSLITARWANDLGRSVFVLPGRVDHPLSGGTLRLAREGATPVLSPAQLLADLYHLAPPPADTPPDERPPDPLLVALVGETLGADSLAARTGLPLGRVLADLAERELEGRVARCPGGLWRLA